MAELVDEVLEQVAESLRIDRGSDEFGNAYVFWRNMVMPSDSDDAASPCRTFIDVCAEEALVCRVFVWRLLRELGNHALLVARESGAAKGTFAVHPGIDALAKTYERLRRDLEKISEFSGDTREERPLGLPDLMKPLLEEAEVVFDELLGPGGFPGRASKNGLDRGTDSEG